MTHDSIIAWVPSAPFRSHVQALMSTTGLPWRSIAIAAEIPPSCVHTLLFGRHGRIRPLLYRPYARQLYNLSTENLRALLRESRSSTSAVRALHELLRAGYHLEDIVKRTGIPSAELQRLLCGRRVCRGFVDIQLHALADKFQLDTGWEDRHKESRIAA